MVHDRGLFFVVVAAAAVVMNHQPDLIEETE